MADLARVGIRDRDDLLALELGDSERLRRFVGQGRLHQDDWPILEFTAPLSLARDRSAEIIIFPGIRFERATEPPAARPRGRRARERDMLSLDD